MRVASDSKTRDGRKPVAGQVFATVRGHREIVLDANPAEAPERSPLAAN